MHDEVYRAGRRKPRLFTEAWFSEVRQNRRLAEGQGDRKGYRRTTTALYFGSAMTFAVGAAQLVAERPIKRIQSGLRYAGSIIAV